MPETAYKDFDRFIGEHKNGPFLSVYLICGEEFLYKKVFDALVDTILAGKKGAFNYEPVDGSTGSVPKALESMNTFSFLDGKKVVALTNSRVFYSKQDELPILQKARAAFDKNEMKKAARHLLNLLSLNRLTIDELVGKDVSAFLKIDFTDLGGSEWADKLVSFASDSGLKVPPAADESAELVTAMEKGFPGSNHLIITTDLVDKRRVLYKTIKKIGMIIDCTVPKGDYKADKQVQEKFLRDSVNSILGKQNKKLEPAAYHALCEMTGFDLRTFSNSLEQLSMYAGNRNAITVDDVNAVLKRTKIDPIYEITNAIAVRSCDDALFYLDSLLGAKFYPLQILAALVNQMRRLILARAFTQSPAAGGWNANMPYNAFCSSVMPAVCEFDKITAARSEPWQGAEAEDTGGKKKKRTKKVTTDLVLAKNPKSPYPVYLLLKNSASYAMDDLLKAFKILGDADYQLKSSGGNPKLILEHAIIKICRKHG